MELFGGALALHLLELVAVTEQLEVLPGGQQQDEDQKSGDADRLPELALLGLVHFADDQVVPHVLLDGVLEGFHQPILSAARSFALRARGLRSTSSSFSTRTRPSRWCSARSVCFTMRSSSE